MSPATCLRGVRLPQATISLCTSAHTHGVFFCFILKCEGNFLQNKKLLPPVNGKSLIIHSIYKPTIYDILSYASRITVGIRQYLLALLSTLQLGRDIHQVPTRTASQQPRLSETFGTRLLSPSQSLNCFIKLTKSHYNDVFFICQ